MTDALLNLHRLASPLEGPLFAALSAGIAGFSRHQARRAILAGLVTVGGETVTAPNHPVVVDAALVCDLRHGVRGAFLRRRHGVPVRSEDAFRVVHADRQLVVVDKAPGVLSAPTHGRGQGEVERGHVPELLRRSFRRQGRELDYIGIVHRLDRDTSGCLCFALSRQAQQLLQRQFAGTAAGRIYRCLVLGQPPQDAGVIAGVMRRGNDGRRTLAEEGPGKEAETRYRVLARGEHGAELEVELGTGRTHQIRVALAGIGCPVFGDRVYARTLRARAPRLMLHAARLELDHPADGRRFIAEAPLPAEYAAFAALLLQGEPPPGSVRAPQQQRARREPRPERAPRDIRPAYAPRSRRDDRPERAPSAARRRRAGR
jgi:23S rRNA pseudouridine1911/1915/1917 synthase